jgi:hypothetical protein
VRHEEEHVEAAKQDRLDGEEVAGDDAGLCVPIIRLQSKVWGTLGPRSLTLPGRTGDVLVTSAGLQPAP